MLIIEIHFKMEQNSMDSSKQALRSGIAYTVASFLAAGMSFITTPIFARVLSKEELFPVAELPFEDGLFHAPACYDKYLRQLYGDYMQLPKEEARKRSHAFSVYWK